MRGRDIKAYEANWAGLWIINSHNGDKKIPAVNISHYPAVKAHLDQYYPQLETRQDQGNTPYNLRSCAYTNEFSKQKIVYPIIASNARFTYDVTNVYTNDKCFLITGSNLKFLLSIFNSKFSFWYLCSIGSLLGSGGFEFRKIYVEQLPIPKIPQKEQQPFINLVEQVLATKQIGKDTTILEAEIDKMVYQLYGLTQSEIAIIES